MKIVSLMMAFVGMFMSAAYSYAGDADAGKQKAAVCTSCHGANGVAMIPTYPSLAGQNELYLVSALKAYKDGSRSGGQAVIMAAMAQGLSDADMANLAAYYYSLK